jgi:hypothetical protein
VTRRSLKGCSISGLSEAEETNTCNTLFVSKNIRKKKKKNNISLSLFLYMCVCLFFPRCIWVKPHRPQQLFSIAFSYRLCWNKVSGKEETITRRGGGGRTDGRTDGRCPRKRKKKRSDNIHVNRKSLYSFFPSKK